MESETKGWTQDFSKTLVIDHPSNLIIQCPLITDQEVETQRSEVACPRSSGYLTQEWCFFMSNSTWFVDARREDMAGFLDLSGFGLFYSLGAIFLKFLSICETVVHWLQVHWSYLSALPWVGGGGSGDSWGEGGSKKKMKREQGLCGPGRINP